MLAPDFPEFLIITEPCGQKTKKPPEGGFFSQCVQA